MPKGDADQLAPSTMGLCSPTLKLPYPWLVVVHPGQRTSDNEAVVSMEIGCGWELASLGIETLKCSTCAQAGCRNQLSTDGKTLRADESGPHPALPQPPIFFCRSRLFCVLAGVHTGIVLTSNSTLTDRPVGSNGVATPCRRRSAGGNVQT